LSFIASERRKRQKEKRNSLRKKFSYKVSHPNLEPKGNVFKKLLNQEYSKNIQPCKSCHLEKIETLKVNHLTVQKLSAREFDEEMSAVHKKAKK